MTDKWLSLVLSELDKLSTGCTVSKIELLLKHIVAFHEELLVVSSMVPELERLLEEQLSIIRKTKKLEAT